MRRMTKGCFSQKPKVRKDSGGMPAKKAVKDKEPPADLPKKPPSAFSRFCTDHRDRFKDKYGELGMVERKEKMSEVWTTMQGSEERKKYEKAFENEMEEWKKACEEVGSKGKKAAGGGKGEEPCNVKAGGKADGVDRGKADGKTSKHDMERKSLLQKLTALGQTLSVFALTCHVAPHRFPLLVPCSSTLFLIAHVDVSIISLLVGH